MFTTGLLYASCKRQNRPPPLLAPLPLVQMRLLERAAPIIPAAWSSLQGRFSWRISSGCAHHAHRWRMCDAAIALAVGAVAQRAWSTPSAERKRNELRRRSPERRAPPTCWPWVHHFYPCALGLGHIEDVQEDQPAFSLAGSCFGPVVDQVAVQRCK